jgi:hypothetical protein
VCPDPTHPEMLDHLLTRCHDETTPVLLDKPTLLPSTVLDDLAARFPHTIVGHHPRLHPAVQAARSRVTSGELGLVHAIHGELLSGPADGDHPSGELRNLAVYALDVVQSMFGGPMRGTGHITSLPATQDCGEAHTVALRLHPDVVVTLLVGRAGPPPPTSASHRTSEHHILHRSSTSTRPASTSSAANDAPSDRRRSSCSSKPPSTPAPLPTLLAPPA